jgi:hypothetical protein
MSLPNKSTAIDIEWSLEKKLMPYIPAAATAVLGYKNLKLQHLLHLPRYTPRELRHWGTYTDLLTRKNESKTRVKYYGSATATKYSRGSSAIGRLLCRLRTYNKWVFGEYQHTAKDHGSRHCSAVMDNDWQMHIRVYP